MGKGLYVDEVPEMPWMVLGGGVEGVLEGYVAVVLFGQMPSVDGEFAAVAWEGKMAVWQLQGDRLVAPGPGKGVLLSEAQCLGAVVSFRPAEVDIFAVPQSIIGEGTLFLLKVSDDLMRGAGILDGDWMIVREVDDFHPQDGQVVVAMVNDDALVRMYRDGQLFTNPADLAAPIAVTEANLLGEAVSMIRNANPAPVDV